MPVYAFLMFLLPFFTKEIPPPAAPNIVIIFTDDQAYGDVGCYGAKGFKTPNLDRMSKEGVRFTDFYVAQGVCSASRAALLTGCYPNRVGIHGALGPRSGTALHHDEMTIAELLKQKNYATAIFGKWHLGDHPDYLPAAQGFDEYAGLAYSNDMWPKHPESPQAWPVLPFWEGTQKVDTIEDDQSHLTGLYTRRAVQFIEKNKNKPFFLYLAHSMPHVPLFASEKFRGRTERGLFGDVIEEIDWSVGEVLKILKKEKLDKNTLVIFTSDNGPWLSYGDHVGSALPLREGKGTAIEGGVRVPCIMRWPGQIPAGRVCRTPMMTIDLLPTIAGLTGTQLPDHPIDGKDAWPLISGKSDQSPQDAYFFYYHTNELQGVRKGPWKLYFPHRYRSLNGRPGGTGGFPAKYDYNAMGLELYNLESDISETKNIAAFHPDIVRELSALGQQCREELGDALTGVQGSGNREVGRPKW